MLRMNHGKLVTQWSRYLTLVLWVMHLNQQLSACIKKVSYLDPWIYIYIYIGTWLESHKHPSAVRLKKAQELSE